jgi:hypothetical protein
MLLCSTVKPLQVSLVEPVAYHRDSYDFALKEIEPEAKYEVTFYPTYVPAKKSVMVGAELQRLKVEIADSPGSLLVEYKRIE